MITSKSWLAAPSDFIHSSLILQWPIFINAVCLPLVFASSFPSPVTLGLSEPTFPGGGAVTPYLKELVAMSVSVLILERL